MNIKKICPVLGPDCKGCPDCSACWVDGSSYEFDEPIFSPAAPDNSGPALGSSEPHTKMPINSVIGIEPENNFTYGECCNCGRIMEPAQSEPLCYSCVCELSQTDFSLADIHAACASAGLSFDLDDSPIQSPALTDDLGIRRSISGVRVVSLTVLRVRSLLRQSVVKRLHTVSIRPLRLRGLLPVYEGALK